MIATVVFVTQATFSLVTFGFIARLVAYPRLAARPLAAALTPLLLFNTLRTIGLCFMVPTLVSPPLSTGFTVPGEVGDMIAVGLAFLALAALRFSWPDATAFVWLFNIEGIADLFYAIYHGITYNIAGGYHLGLVWLIPTYLMPAYIVTHIVIFALLLRRPVSATARTAVTAVTGRSAEMMSAGAPTNTPLNGGIVRSYERTHTTPSEELRGHSER